MMFLKQSSLLALAACLGLGLVGCQPSDPNKPNVADLESIAVTPNPVSLEVGGVQALTVTGRYSDDSSYVVTFDSTFASDDPDVARVDAATGYVTAVAAGTARITATHTPSGKTATTDVTVAPLRVLSIAVSPAAVTLAPGATQALTVNATYNNLTTGPVTAGSTFVSSDPTVATVDAAGVVAAVAVGTANIRATHTASGNTAEAAVTVAESRDFTTITFDEPGVVVRGFAGAEDSQVVTDPTDATNTMALVVRSATAETYAGTVVSIYPGNETVDRIPFTATGTRMSVRVYSPAAGIRVLLKVEDSADPANRFSETDAFTTRAGAWETLTFDFANGTPALNLSYNYNRLIIFFNFGVTGAVAGEQTFYFDDVTFVGEGGASGNTGTCSAPCIDFSSASVKYEAFEGLVSAAQADDPVDATNKVAKFVKGPAGQPWAGATIYTVDADKSVPAFDLSTNKVVTLRVYAPAAGQKIRLKLEDAADNTIYLEKDALTTVANQWETLSFDFAAPDNGTYNPANTYNRVSVFPMFLALPTAEVTYYFDELKYTTSGSSGGPVVFASNYSQLDPSNWKSAEGGNAGTYIDTGVPTQYWWNGFAPNDATPSFYFGYGISVNAKPWGFGAFVKAPGNGTADVTGKTNLKIAVWGNDELMNTRPTLTLILKGPTVNSCTSELKGSVAVAAPGVQNYTVALATFTLQTPCGYASAAAALAAGVTEVHIQVLGTNVQYVTGTPPDYPNGLNVGPISFD